jgi:hypothetical protein
LIFDEKVHDLKYFVLALESLQKTTCHFETCGSRNIRLSVSIPRDTINNNNNNNNNNVIPIRPEIYQCSKICRPALEPTDRPIQ